MAYVRKTDTLVNDIERKCYDMSRKAQEQYRNQGASINDAQKLELIEAAHVSAWSDAPELRNKMPDAWIFSPEDVDLRMYGPKDTDGNAVQAMTQQVRGVFKLPSKREYSSYRPDVDVAYEHLPASVKQMVADQASSKKKLTETKQKFENIKTQLRDYMNQHASLNTALKEMPQLEMYVPDEYMRKIRAASAPRAKVEPRSNVVDLNIDVDELTAAAITHRIATA